MNLISRFEILRNPGTSMKTLTWPIREADGTGCLRQITAEHGGMTRAWFRHRPIDFAFHWRGICRAILAGVIPDSQPPNRSPSQRPTT